MTSISITGSWWDDDTQAGWVGCTVTGHDGSVDVAIQVNNKRTTLWMVSGVVEPTRMPSWRHWGWVPDGFEAEALNGDLRERAHSELGRIRAGGAPVEMDSADGVYPGGTSPGTSPD